MKMKLKSNESPQVDGLYFVLNDRGFLSLCLWQNNKWYKMPDIILSHDDEDFYWIDQPERSKREDS